MKQYKEAPSSIKHQLINPLNVSHPHYMPFNGGLGTDAENEKDLRLACLRNFDSYIADLRAEFIELIRQKNVDAIVETLDELKSLEKRTRKEIN